MFKSGDILLYAAPTLKFSNIIPRLIRLITGNEVIHTAIYLKSDGNNSNLVLDALPSGIYIKTFTDAELLNRLDDLKLYGIAYLPNLFINSSNTICLVAAKYAYHSYGYFTIINLLLQHLKTRIFTSSLFSIAFKSKDAYICSEVCRLVVDDVLRLNNIPSPFNKLPALTEPDDYLKHPWEIIKLID